MTKIVIATVMAAVLASCSFIANQPGTANPKIYGDQKDRSSRSNK